MAGHDYFLLIPPLVIAMFAASFTVISRIDPTVPGATRFALAYTAGTVSLLMDYLLLDNLDAWGGYPTNIPYMLSGALYAWAVFGRFGVPASRAVCIGVPLAQFAAYTAFVIEDDLLARVAVMNLGGSITLFGPVPFCWPYARRPIERVILVLIGLGALQYAVRAAILLPVEGSTLTPENYGESLLVNTNSFLTGLIGALIALLLIIDQGIIVVSRMRRLAHTDPTTGLLNRRGLEGAIAARASSRGGRSGSIIVADVDQFAMINARQGHQAGLAVLRELARILRVSFGPEHDVARLEGGRFVLVLWDAPLDTAAAHAERLRLALRSRSIQGGSDGPVTVSLGVAPVGANEPLTATLERSVDPRRLGGHGTATA